MKYFRYNIIFLMLFVLLAVLNVHADERLCAFGNRLNIVDLDVRQALIKDLRKDSISIELRDNGEICYPSNLRNQITVRLIAIHHKFHPSNYITIAGDGFEVRVFEKLDEAGINYDHSNINDHEVLLIVKNEEEIDVAVDIIDSVARDMFSGKK